MNTEAKKKQEEIVSETTCFNEHAKFGVACKRTNCRNWINLSRCNNCSLLAAQEGTKTLEEIGNVFGLTRMRICQIEKTISKKFLDVIQQN